jgi:hypothetical protein
MDWNKALVVGAQIVVVCVLGGLVAIGRDSAVTDALLAVSGSIVLGLGLPTVVSKIKPPVTK